MKDGEFDEMFSALPPPPPRYEEDLAAQWQRGARAACARWIDIHTDLAGLKSDLNVVEGSGYTRAALSKLRNELVGGFELVRAICSARGWSLPPKMWRRLGGDCHAISFVRTRRLGKPALSDLHPEQYSTYAFLWMELWREWAQAETDYVRGLIAAEVFRITGERFYTALSRVRSEWRISVRDSMLRYLPSQENSMNFLIEILKNWSEPILVYWHDHDPGWEMET